MNTRAETAETLLKKVFDGARDGMRRELPPGEYEKRRRDFVFHLKDVRGDLLQLYELLDKPESFDELDASNLVIGFLYHVIPHLNAAGRLLLDTIEDPFAQPDSPS